MTDPGKPGADPGRTERLRAARERWEQDILQPALERAPERRDTFTTTSGAPVERVYTSLDLGELEEERDLGLPGAFPFTRGIHPTGYRGRLWTMRLFAGFGTAEETNARFHYLLREGQSGLSIAFDVPTLMGRDTDDPAAEGEFGACGVAVSSLADMEILLRDLPLDRVTTSMTINSPAAVIWAMYIVAAEKMSFPRANLGGTLQNDILKEYIAQNEYLFPPSPSLRLVVDTIEYASRALPRWNPISISGYHIREAGSTAAQELAFTLADGFAYVDACLERGLDVDDFAPRLSFFFNAHNDLFEEVAKYRAARRIWARAMRDRYRARNPRSWWLRFHTQTAGCSLTAQQPENNVVRTTIQALAAVMGGTQSLHTNSMDEALALPSDLAARVALRTQQIIAEESGLANSVDPLAGSYLVEAETNRLEREAEAYFEQIRRRGGMIEAIEQQFPQREIADAAYRYQYEIDTGQRTIVGVNGYRSEEPLSIPILRIDPAGEERHRARLHQVRAERDRDAHARALAELRRAAAGPDNLMPVLIDAVSAYATLGEICGVLREVFGEYNPPPVL